MGTIQCTEAREDQAKMLEEVRLWAILGGGGGRGYLQETDGDEEGADAGGREAFLGRELAVCGAEGGLVGSVEVVPEAGHDDQAADEDPDEGEARKARVEMVDALEDEGEGFEPEVLWCVVSFVVWESYGGREGGKEGLTRIA